MTLGETLKHHRERVGLTLRQVEEAVGISNAYLSQLENDKIKKPSASALYKVGSLYGVTIDELLIAAGKIERIPLTVEQQLTEDEEKQLIEYLKWLRTKKHNI